MDPLIKSHQITLIYQAHFDISSVRSGIEPERKLENVETKIELGSTRAIAPSPPLSITRVVEQDGGRLIHHELKCETPPTGDGRRCKG